MSVESPKHITCVDTNGRWTNLHDEELRRSYQHSEDLEIVINCSVLKFDLSIKTFKIKQMIFEYCDLRINYYSQILTVNVSSSPYDRLNRIVRQITPVKSHQVAEATPAHKDEIFAKFCCAITQS